VSYNRVPLRKPERRMEGAQVPTTDTIHATRVLILHNQGEEYKKTLLDASSGDYLAVAFNVDCLEVLSFSAERAKEHGCPIIFQFGPWSFRQMGPEQIAGAFRALTDGGGCVFLHLDHSRDAETIERCVAAGFDSVMFDGSDLDLEENIQRTRRIVELARSAGVAVEGAVGRLERGVDTRAEEAVEFVERTQVDALAVAVGTGHGTQKSREDIDLDRLRTLSEAVARPLVIHGGSGLPEEVVPEVRKTRAAKVNVATVLYHECQARLRELITRKGEVPHLGFILQVASEAMWQTMRRRMELFGCWDRCVHAPAGL